MKKPNRVKQWLRRLAIKTLFPVDQSRGWVSIIHESFLGAFQTHTPLSLNNSLSHPTVYACVSQIAYDVGKLRLSITKEDENGIPLKTNYVPYTSLLKKPNKYQTRQKFIESWLVSLLTYGNTYALKGRGEDRKVKELHILDPNKIEPLISEDGSVFYKIKKDRLAKVSKDIEAIPAYEIIHDTAITLFHPLIGVSPLYAADLATQQGLAIQNHSTSFFENMAKPSGLLTAPGHIKKDVADRIVAAWQDGYSGKNTGKIAVLGDGLEYKQMSENATDSELVGQLQWSDEKICSTFKVPPYKVHVGKLPTYEHTETLDRKYYSDCLQRYIESIESLLDAGLGLPDEYGTQFNLDDLIRMDFKLQMETQAIGVKGGFLAPDEARRKLNYVPVKGGHTPYMQQQNFSLEALNSRDKTNPLVKVQKKPKPPPETDETEKFLYTLIKKDIPGVYRD